MKKRSKLPEKATRMPDIREAEMEREILKYLEGTSAPSSEQAKSQRFLLLLDHLFGLQPGFIEDYLSGIEAPVKVRQKDRILRGEVDNLFGSLVIEFESDLSKKKGEAEGQLKKYITCLWSQETPAQRTPYLCIATDGLHFNVYSPVISDISAEDIQPEEVRLQSVDEVDWSVDLKPLDVYFWLDRYFQRQEILSPKTESIVADFGVESHAFSIASQTLSSLWNSLRDQSTFKVVYESWEKYLRIVYGTSVADEELFVRHTYLATLAKLMAWRRLSEERGSLDDAKIFSVIEGEFFKNQGIENFLEEDFFSWIAREGANVYGIEVARRLLSLLQNYNLKELSEDVLKALYQELVDPKARHDLGEYYTPDWLAHRMVLRLIEENPKGSFLDPACGSGTFLYLVVREKRNRLGDSIKTLEHIRNSVAGVDIHPLAVIIAKTNYLLALGDLLKKRKGKISIPIYLANSIRLPEAAIRVRAKKTQPSLDMPIKNYEVKLDDETVSVPTQLLAVPAVYDEAIDAVKEYATQSAGRELHEGQFLSYLRAHHPVLAEDKSLVEALLKIAKILKAFIDSGRDTIQAFVLKNIFKPVFLKSRFDFVMGNPPWLSYRYVDQIEYQNFLKEQITERYRLLSGRGELITHMELGTLFFVGAADLYLKEGGTIAFVLPRSVFSADQHDALRQKALPGMRLALKEIWDLEAVEPLFGVPACVLMARKEGKAKISYPIAGLKFSGKLERRNASLSEAEEHLTIDTVEFHLHQRGKRSFWSTEAMVIAEKGSYYRRHFREGATIVPRSFWFVDLKPSLLGFDPSLPLLESSRRAKEQAKAPYKGLIIEGRVESQFLYATLLSTDLLPFGRLNYRLLVLPIEPSGEGYKLITSEEANKRGFVHLSRWLKEAQEEWEERRGEKAETMDIYERLDRVHGYKKHNQKSKYR